MLKIFSSPKKFIQRKVDAIKYRILRRRFLNFCFQDLLLKVFIQKDTSPFLVVQVGAYDGVSGDPLYSFLTNHSVKAILLEPQEKVFKKLTENYANLSNIECLNVALDRENVYRTIYKISEKIKSSPISKSFEDLDISQLASFSKEVILKESYRSEQLLSYITSEKVRTISVSSLKKTYDFKHVDVLVIDTEGYDFEIIKMFFEEDIHPLIILFESKHLSPQEYFTCMEFLMSKKAYKLSDHEGGNTLAIRADLISR